MSQVILTANDIIAAINEHKSDADPEGDSAFLIKPSRDKKFLDFCIKHKGSWRPFAFKFQDLKSLYGNDPETAKYPGFSVCFALTETYQQADGTEQPIGLALQLTCQAFKRIMKRMIDREEVVGPSTKITHPAKIDRYNAEKRRFEEYATPFFSMKVPFTSGKDRVLSPHDPPSIFIFDESKPIPPGDPRYSARDWNYEKATDANGNDITYGTIGKFITRGSQCTGWARMSSVFVGPTGFNLGCRAAMLSVKSAGANSGTTNVFTSDEVAPPTFNTTIPSVTTAVTADEDSSFDF